MHAPIEKNWKVLASRENEYADRCLDVFRRADGTFGFEEFRRDPEDMGAWTQVSFFSARSFPTRSDAWSAAARSVAWLAADATETKRGMTATVAPPDPAGFVARWLQHWNDHDIEGLLGHFAEDVVFTSPVARQLISGSDGVIRGKAALRDYWTLALTRIPDLRFELVDVYVGLATLVINYRNQTGKLVNEVLVFAGPLVVEGHGTYLDRTDNPAGVTTSQ